MKSLVAVLGPSDAGPGERYEMQDRARGLVEQCGIEPADVIRIDVPGRVSGAETDEETEAGALRPPIEPIVPALQSGSLFGGDQAVVMVDAHQLLKAEAEIVAGLLDPPPDGVLVVLVADGSLPSPLAKAVKAGGETITVKKMRERDAGEWLVHAARSRGMRLDAGTSGALLQRFGSDVAGLGQALDQLAASGEPVTASAVQERFRNRPEEPIWLYGDAVSAGRTGEALRRLSDFLTHGHPLQLVAFLENDLRRKALAAAAPDIETFASWVGGSPGHFPTQKAWKARSRVSDGALQRALDAVYRADQQLKTAPEETHRITLERLTVALSRWYGSSARRAG